MDSLELNAVAALLELGANRHTNHNHHTTRQDKEHNDILETLNNPIQNMATLCMPTIKNIENMEMETDPPLSIVKLSLDKAMQTDDLPPQVPVEKLKELEAVVMHLHTRFLKLVESLQLDRQVFPTSHSDKEQNRTLESKRDRNDQILSGEINGSQHMNDSNVETKGHNSKSLHVRKVSAHTTNSEQDAFPRNNMVPIGSGNAAVPVRIWKQLDWSSYKLVTRQLLHAFFSRKVLATHSLTGKQSPAFINKPAKEPLEPKLIDDIVDIVSNRCNVTKRAVRTCITIKCTDEAKLYRNRMQGRPVGRPAKVPAAVDNRENVPLSPTM